MNEILALILALILSLLAGVLLGTIFFGGLWWTIRKGILVTLRTRVPIAKAESKRAQIVGEICR